MGDEDCANAIATRMIGNDPRGMQTHLESIFTTLPELSYPA